MNNLKEIREICNLTQEELAKEIGVNRVTISAWETNTNQAPKTKLEKLSLFYGIGPEFFYEKALYEPVYDLLNKAAANLQQKKENMSPKAESLADILNTCDFKEAKRLHILAMKIMLATADEASLDDLESALAINQKLQARLAAMVACCREELNSTAQT